MDNQRKEIQRILLGRLMRTEDGHLTAVPPGQRMQFQGLVNGWGTVRFLGMTRRMRTYQLENKLSVKEVQDILSRMGQAVELQASPKASACLCSLFLMAPVLVSVETTGTELRVTADTGRDPFAPMLCRRVLEKFAKGLPETAVLVAEERPKKPEKPKKSDRQKKKEKKNEQKDASPKSEKKHKFRWKWGKRSDADQKQ